MNFTSISNRSLLGKLLRLPLRVLPNDMIVPIVQGPLRGKRWIAKSGVHGYWLGSHEMDKQNLFISHIKSGDVVYDIGAHVGYYTLLAAHTAGQQGRVYAFEPSPRNTACLRRHLELNHIENVKLYPIALSNYNGSGYFDEGLSSSEGYLDSNPQHLKVEIASLDTLVSRDKLAAPNILKIDIEGAEFDMLSGARQILSDYAPKIFLATHGAEIHQKCLALLQELAYEVQSITEASVAQSNEVLAFKSV